MRQAVPLFGLQQVVDDVFRGCGEFVFHVVQQREKLLDGADPGEDIGVGAPLDQFFQLGTGSIEDGGDAQPFLAPQNIGQFGGIAGGGRPANRWKAIAPSENTSEASVTLRESDRASGDM